MLRKKYYIAIGVKSGTEIYTVRFKRTKPGDFRCSGKCNYRNICDYWRFANRRIRTMDICVTYPRTSETLYTRHYYSPYVIKKM